MDYNRRRKLELIITPSSVVKEDLKDVRVEGNACLNLYSLSRMLDFYRDPALSTAASVAEVELTECASALFYFVRNHTSHRVGPFTVARKPNAKTVSGVFAAQLQHLFSRFLFPDQQQMPDILVATGQKLVCGSIDATIYKRLEEAGLHPRVLFQFAVDNINKESQLFAHVNNASTVMEDSLQFLMTGCVVTMFRDRPTDSRLQVFTYVKIRPPSVEDKNGKGARIAAIPIFNGSWSLQTVKRLLRMLRNLLQLPMRDFVMPESDLLPYERIRENVLIDGAVVYKIYDYGNSGWGRERRPGGNIAFLGAEVVVRDERDLCVIRYPLVEGDHIAQLAVEFVGVLLHLRDVHAADQLHMDVKLGNVIFNHSDGAASRLIDFDFSGLAGVISYPERYNHNIVDGQRHKDAVAENRGFQSHDHFAMMSVMRLFQPSNRALAGQWEEWCTRVGQGQLEQVANELAERGTDVELELDEKVQVRELTEDPPELQGGHKRKRGSAAQDGVKEPSEEEEDSKREE